jgi:hypothetical protein
MGASGVGAAAAAAAAADDGFTCGEAAQLVSSLPALAESMRLQVGVSAGFFSAADAWASGGGITVEESVEQWQ